jgi:hypothetical protein
MVRMGPAWSGPWGEWSGRAEPKAQMAAVAQQRPTGRKVEADRRQRCDRPGRS